MFFVLFFMCASAFAEDSVFLKQDEVVRLKVPDANPELSRIKYDDETLYSSRKAGSNYFYDEKETVFESKAGKAFNKFIDTWAIDNKINNYSMKLAE